MKNILKFVLLFSLTFITSCNNDDINIEPKLTDEEKLNQVDSHKMNSQFSNRSGIYSSSRSNGYSHDKKVKVRYPDWLSKLDDSKHLSELSIPGTHDTMSFYGGDAVKTQSMSLENQLESGIRVLDIRCRDINGVFAIHHGRVFQRTYFGNVLRTTVNFLKKHPKETIYMRVKKEHSGKNTEQIFFNIFKKRYWKYYKQNFWKPRNSRDINPTLKRTRGKIVLLRNFVSKETNSSVRYGIPWDKLKIQDDYNMKSNWRLYRKWLKVKKHLGEANKKTNINKTYVNFLSGSKGSFPYFVVSGKSSPQTNAPRLRTGHTTATYPGGWADFPRVSCIFKFCSIAFEGTNILTTKRLGTKGFENRSGIIMTDFPGPDLITQIIKLNQ